MNQDKIKLNKIKSLAVGMALMLGLALLAACGDQLTTPATAPEIVPSAAAAPAEFMGKLAVPLVGSRFNWAPDGKSLITYSELSRSLLTWQTEGKPLQVFNTKPDKDHPLFFSTAALSPDGKLLATALRGSGFSEPGAFQLWDVAQGKLLSSTPTSVLSVLVWSPDSKIVAASTVAKPAILLWTADGKLIKTVENVGSGSPRPQSLAWSPDGKTLATAGQSGETLFISPEGNIVKKLPGFSNVLAWSPDGKTLASAISTKTIRLWSAEGLTLADLDAAALTLAWSPDGKTLASGGPDNLVRLWSTDGKSLATLSGHQDILTGLAWSPDGKKLASAALDGTVRIWSPEGKALFTLNGSGFEVNQVAWSPDGNRLASASVDGIVRLWK